MKYRPSYHHHLKRDNYKARFNVLSEGTKLMVLLLCNSCLVVQLVAKGSLAFHK